MKTLFVVLLFCSVLAAQNLYLGVGTALLFSNSETNTGGGAVLFAETNVYSMINLRGSASFFISEFSTENPILKTQQYYQTQFELSGILRPIKWSIEPYLGIGIGYYNPENQQSGNIGFLNGNPIKIEDLKSGIGNSIILGIDLSPNKTINLIFEFKRVFFNTDYNYSVNKIEAKKDIDLSSNSVSLLLRVNVL